MFRQLLSTQFKWSGFGVAALAVAAFTLPLLTVQGAGVGDPTLGAAREMLEGVESWGRAYPLLALAAGLLIGTTAWTNDHRGRHVYSLVLPMPRWHYVLLRYGAGLVLLVAPIITLWVGTLLASTTATIPEGLNAYPHAVGLRFALASMLAFSAFFAISAGTARTAGYTLSIIGSVLVLQLFLRLTGSDTNVLAPLFDRMVTWPGPFEIFSGSWMLIDV
jgi:hypothetical protein